MKFPGCHNLRRIVLNKLQLKGTEYTQIHASGHSGLRDLCVLINKIKPTCLLPTHSNMATTGIVVDALKKLGYSLSLHKKYRIHLLSNTQKLMIHTSG